jgi:hypothetical protein
MESECHQGNLIVYETVEKVSSDGVCRTGILNLYRVCYCSLYISGAGRSISQDALILSCTRSVSHASLNLLGMQWLTRQSF